MPRKNIPKNIEQQVLTLSRRRCCICYGLYGDTDVKKGQIAHLDKNNENNNLDNLAFLCLDHHNEYDSRTSQSKNFTIKEVKKYREELYKDIPHILNKYNEADYTNQRKSEVKKLIIEILEENDGYISNIRTLQYKIGLPSKKLEKYLYELEKEKIIRIDRPKGKRNKTYSLVSTKINKIIDAFIEELKSVENNIDDVRYIKDEEYVIDGIITTEKTTTL